ncbi:MAG TPA: primosomal protein N' [Mycobacteriales bacterium]|nr:primosomal protein N' [Mycobacteriales bacterium]
MREPAERDPVARVAVDVPLPHLDRPFDYLVPSTLDEAVRPGSRVRVRFAGQLVDGIVLDRAPDSGHRGRLAFVERAVSAEPVLSAEIATLARAAADRWAGSLPDVLRLALPPRHARVEAEPASAPATAGAADPDPGPAGGTDPGPGPAGGAGWGRYPAGAAWLRAVGDGRPARAVWSALPDEDWPARVAEAVRTARAAGRGALVVLPDHRDQARVDAALTAALGPGGHVALSADLGPAERYRRWLAVRRGLVGAVVGTRAAAFAPVADLGLIVLWDDGDDLHAEPRAPYPHARELLVLRAHLASAAMLLGGYARTAEAQSLVGSGWAHEVVAERATVRAVAPRVVAVGDEFEVARDPAARTARLPSVAWRAARDALAAGAPVLVQVPRRGYRPVLACARCRTPARCRHCHGPLAASSGHAIPACRWCGRPAGQWACAVCANQTLRAVVVGSTRTAEELGRAFPGTPVRLSGALLTAAEHEPGRVPADRHDTAPGSAGEPGLAAARETVRRLSPGPAPASSSRSSGTGREVDPASGDRASGAGREGDRASGAGREVDRASGAAAGRKRRRAADRGGVLATVPAAPALIVATPGAEPVAEGGYGAALLLDGWALLTRPDLRAAEETLRRWLNAAALVRPAADGGRVIVGADGGLAVVQALVRWDPAWFAARELAERSELGFPPAARFASLTGTPAAVADLLEAARLPATAELLGPVPAGPLPGAPAGEETERLLVRTPRLDGPALARALHDAAAVRSARKSPEPVRVQLDPLELL